jgi:hypothetical protein
MRLKVAEVLVDDGEEIQQFVDRERDRQRRGIDIYSAHEHLWAVSVFVHESVRRDKAMTRRVLAHLARKMHIRLGGLESELGRKPWEWPDRLAARDAVDRVGRGAVSNLVELRRRQIAAYSRDPDKEPQEPTYDALVQTYIALAEGD